MLIKLSSAKYRHDFFHDTYEHELELALSNPIYVVFLGDYFECFEARQLKRFFITLESNE